ncbi:MAG: hypothetical protein ACI4WP_00840 [Bacilli bacterium]
MKDKLETNMYVRTKWGYICKIININDFREPNMKYGVEASYLKDIMFIGDDDVIKASYNIIDILEEGDYVNGYLVTDVYKPDGNEVFRIEIERDTLKGHIIDKSSQIKSIVTKEQFESIKYSLEGVK